MGDFAKKVYFLVRGIPLGKVMTYGQIAQQLGKPKASRVVGSVLHRNSDPTLPCHRVVNKDGRVALNYKFGGWREQKRKLGEEGIKFKDKMSIDFSKI